MSASVVYYRTITKIEKLDDFTILHFSEDGISLWVSPRWSSWQVGDQIEIVLTNVSQQRRSLDAPDPS